MAALDGKIKLPLVGEVPKKGAVIGGVVFAGFIGFMYIRHRNNAATTNANPLTGTAAATAGTTGMVTDPAGNQCAAVDASGYCPGSQESSDYLASQGGGYAGYGGGYGDYGGGGGYGYGGGYGGGTGGSTGTTTPTTADQWVVQTAAEIPGSSSAFEAAAAKVFAGLTVTTAQKDLFLEGVGLNPLPPGITYPQPIKTSDTSGHHGGKVAVPPTTGHSSHVAVADIQGAGLKAVLNPPTPAGEDGIIQSSEPPAGTMVNTGSTVTLINKLHKGKG